jgi:hypothetical protein
VTTNPGRSARAPPCRPPRRATGPATRAPEPVKETAVQDQTVTAESADVVIGTDPPTGYAWLELSAPTSVTSVQLREHELRATIEALARAYGELCGDRPEGVARAVSQTLRRRARARRPLEERPLALTGGAR